MRHTIQPHEYKDLSFDHLLAASSGKGSNKRLQAVVSLDGDEPYITFEVIDHKLRVFESQSLDEAVKAYNDEP